MFLLIRVLLRSPCVRGGGGGGGGGDKNELEEVEMARWGLVTKENSDDNGERTLNAGSSWAVVSRERRMLEAAPDVVVALILNVLL